MSTSPKPAPVRNASRAPAAYTPEAAATAQPFPYHVISPGTLPRTVAPHGARDAMSSTGAPAGDTEKTRIAASEVQARAQGHQEGMAEAGKIFEEQLARERSVLAAALAQFSGDRAAYFDKMEAEVVQLALAISRKILHREAQIDPLLLVGIVRVTLEKIDGATGVRLRVHPENAPDWRRYFAIHLEPSELPEIVEDSAQPPDQCTLETAMGTAVIGVEVQLKEIEHGLLDLLAARPSTGHSGAQT
jgi:flagellar assembly protein FliH